MNNITTLFLEIAKNRKNHLCNFSTTNTSKYYQNDGGVEIIFKIRLL